MEMTVAPRGSHRISPSPRRTGTRSSGSAATRHRPSLPTGRPSTASASRSSPPPRSSPTTSSPPGRRPRRQAGVASAIDPTELVREVQQVRRSADTVIVYVHWGTETQSCPNPQQGPLAEQLVKAGADIVIGADAHVLSGAGYLGSAYVDYGLGNFAFYDDTPPETSSGSLIVTAAGRHVVGVTFRPATIVGGLPQPLTGAPAASALASWVSARGCTGLSTGPAASLATMRSENVPFVAPPASPPSATTTSTPGSTAGSSSTTTSTTARGLRRPSPGRHRQRRVHVDHRHELARLHHDTLDRQRRGLRPVRFSSNADSSGSRA